MITEATRSLETAAGADTPKTRMRTGVIRAPPPIPVIPTTKPTMRPASAIEILMWTLRDPLS
jgi:hypothetical protein